MLSVLIMVHFLVLSTKNTNINTEDAFIYIVNGELLLYNVNVLDE